MKIIARKGSSSKTDAPLQPEPTPSVKPLYVDGSVSVPRALLCAPDLDAFDKAIILAIRACDHKGTNQSAPGYERLRLATGLSMRTLQRHIDRLVVRGKIKVTPHKRGRNSVLAIAPELLEERRIELDHRSLCGDNSLETTPQIRELTTVTETGHLTKAGSLPVSATGHSVSAPASADLGSAEATGSPVVLTTDRPQRLRLMLLQCLDEGSIDALAEEISANGDWTDGEYREILDKLAEEKACSAADRLWLLDQGVRCPF